MIQNNQKMKIQINNQNNQINQNKNNQIMMNEIFDRNIILMILLH